MKIRLSVAAQLVLLLPAAFAQVVAHKPALTPMMPAASPTALAPGGDEVAPSMTVTDKPVARVNGQALTDRDLLREMFAIFPYARQHNGFPKSLEPEIRKGALEMIVFEELVYQEAQRRHVNVSPERMNRAEADFVKQFSSRQEFEEYLKLEHGGSREAMRKMIRRSLLIEALLKTDVAAKAKPTPAEVRAYYDKNLAQFKYPESFSIQTISIIPPANPSPDVRKEARRRADDAFRKALATKSFNEFGLLAEKLSDDDWHVKMGDRKSADRAALPPEVVKAALAMKPGEVSPLIQLGENYTMFRLNAHTQAGTRSFAEVKDKLRSDMEKLRNNELRGTLNKKLREKAKVELL